MEDKLKKCSSPVGQAVPSVRTDPSSKHHHHHKALKLEKKKIPVVYYLCRNRHLDHPHFIEVPLSHPDGLFLRDVISRLNVVRGAAMPAMYSWSCKRSYKNGFVWHDLGEDDLVLPAGGNEYVLKGSELLHDSAPPDRPPPPPHSAANVKPHSRKNALQEVSPVSPPRNYIAREESEAVEYRIYEPVGAADVSTQTDDGARRTPRSSTGDTRTRGVSTDDGSSDVESEIERTEISPPPASSSESSSGGKMETLESLIRADAQKMSSFRVLEEEELFLPNGPKLKAANLLMQLITCGSITVKNHRGFGLVPAYRPRFSQAKFDSPPMCVASSMLSELDCLSENPRFIGLRLEDKEYFSGSLIETKKQREQVQDDVPVLKRSSSYNAERGCKSPESKREKERLVVSSHSKCLPRTIKITSHKQSRKGTMRSPLLSEGPRNSSAMPDSSLSASLPSSKGGSKRFTDPSTVKGSSMRIESFREDKEKVIKIEESLLQELVL